VSHKFKLVVNKLTNVSNKKENVLSMVNAHYKTTSPLKIVKKKTNVSVVLKYLKIVTRQISV